MDIYKTNVMVIVHNGAVYARQIALALSLVLLPMAVQAANTNSKSAHQSTHQNAVQTYVIDTYGGAALLPAVRQQLNNSRDGGSVSAYQDKLVLRTTTANYQAVQQLLRQIDGQPQAVMVSVRVGNNSTSQDNMRQGQVIISNQGIQGAGVITQSSGQQQNNSLYQVQTLSGSPASISTGTLWSLTQTYNAPVYPSYHRPSGQIFIQQQILLPTTQGIHVTPRLLANGQVEVQLNQVEEKLVKPNPSYSQNGHNQNGYNQSNAINRQALNSTIIIPRGQWTVIGQITQSSQNQSSSYGSNRTNNSNNSAPIWLLVQ